MRPLDGRRVALLEARMSGELADLVRRHGGVPIQVPAVREVRKPCAAEVTQFLKRLDRGAIDFVVLLTGTGVSALVAEAEQQGEIAGLLSALRRVTTVCRGPKPAAVLHRHGIIASVQAAEPYTSIELLTAMERLQISGRGVGLVHYGERDAALFAALSARGAVIDELCLYEWLLPEDLAPLRSLVNDVVAGTCDAVVFTSQIQCRHLLEVAALAGAERDLIVALNERTTVASVGPVCSAALNRVGVKPHVVPSRPKMAPLIAALGDHFTNAGQEKGI